MGVKMVLSGEGADEIFGGYLYFHKAPNAKEFFDETRDKVSYTTYAVYTSLYYYVIQHYILYFCTMLCIQ
jgi:asparagine synthetase B (glutamine-hydrolysing)